MTPDPLPPELQLLRADLAAAAHRRADRRLRRRLRARLAALGLGTVLLGSTVAVAAGLVDPLGVVKGDAREVTVIGGPRDGQTLRCTTRNTGGRLCHASGRGLPVGQFAERLRAAKADAGITASATACRGGRCRQLVPPDTALETALRGVVTYQRTGVRPAAQPHRTGGYRSAEPLVTWISVDGARAVPCSRTTARPARACRRLRAAQRERPFVLARLPRRLEARQVVLETGSRCRLGRRFTCAPLPLAAARERSRHPERLPQATVVSYSRVVVRR